MRRLGKWWIASENEIRDIVVGTMPMVIAREQANLVKQALLRACYAADVLIHTQAEGRPMTEQEQTVCELLVLGIASELRPGSQ